MRDSRPIDRNADDPAVAQSPGEALLTKAKEKANACGREPRVRDEHAETLALAWARGEVSLSQVARALNIGRRSVGTSYSFLARGLRHYIRRTEGRP